MKKEHFNVKGMSCAACQAHVDKAVRNTEGVIDCNVNLLTNSMDVEYDESICSASLISKSVKKAGYSASLSKDRTIKRESTKKSLILLIISGILCIALMYVSMGSMIHLPVPELFVNHEYAIYYFLIQFALTIPVIVIYNHYFINGFKRLFKSPNMDSLIALGATASLIYGIFAFVMICVGINSNNMDIVSKYHHNLYLDSVSMILTLVSLGKYLEEISKRKTTKAIESLVDLSPKTARRIRDDIEETLEVKDIDIGDIVLVKTGEMIPVDGIIIEGEGTIEESNLTGESIPLFKGRDKEVYASTILKSGYLKVQATKKGEDSSFNTIIKLVEEASSSKAPISRLVDEISLYFVPSVIAIALLTFTIHLIIYLVNKSPSAFEDAFNYGVTVLVIACPCALGLATPVSIMVATGKGAKSGLIIKNAEILEKSQKIDTVVLDKTGTITEGHPSVTNIQITGNDKEILDVIYSIESLSNHPLAEAITNYAKENNASLLEINDFENIIGKGLKGKYKNNLYLIGNESILGDLRLENEEIDNLYKNSIKEGKTVVFVSKNNNIVGILSIRDEIRETSKTAIKNLQDLGIEVVMLTGDKKETAEAIARELNINRVIPEVLPLQKSDIIKSLQGEGRKVLMVGDGVNDTLALTNADIGIAIGGGSDAALENSDIVLIRKDLRDVSNAIRLSKRTMNTIKVALFWAFFYNVIMIVLASGSIPPVVFNPMIASICMSISSVFVVLTALSINLFKNK